MEETRKPKLFSSCTVTRYSLHAVICCKCSLTGFKCFIRDAYFLLDYSSINSDVVRPRSPSHTVSSVQRQTKKKIAVQFRFAWHWIRPCVLKKNYIWKVSSWWLWKCILIMLNRKEFQSSCGTVASLSFCKCYCEVDSGIELTVSDRFTKCRHQQGRLSIRQVCAHAAGTADCM